MEPALPLGRQHQVISASHDTPIVACRGSSVLVHSLLYIEILLKQTLKFVIVLCLTTAFVVAVHAFAFAVCTLPSEYGNQYHKGDRVVVNKLVHDNFQRGDLVLYYPDWHVTSRYADSPMNIGRIEALPGDTIRLDKDRFRIPLRCCHKCRCMDCKIYLVNTGQGQTLVHLHQIVGKAYRITL